MLEYKEINPVDLNENTFKMIGKDFMLITAENEGKVNAMTASWGGLGVLWNMDVVFIFLRPQRYTKEFIDATDSFSLTFYDDSYKKTLGYLGSVSGRDEDKIYNSNLTIGFDGKTPYFKEAEKVIICKKLFAQDLKEESFLDKNIINKDYPNKDFHTLYVGKIEKILIK
ncbi:MAG: hypothetical protein K0Q97_237 [Bacillota bacterium]|jgi:flavin reductase (DIM6/NTAB) family NADH-FMN oxidoreductase RutF|nr:hypothetical protein [Bacillota bacterium]